MVHMTSSLFLLFNISFCCLLQPIQLNRIHLLEYGKIKNWSLKNFWKYKLLKLIGLETAISFVLNLNFKRWQRRRWWCNWNLTREVMRGDGWWIRYRWQGWNSIFQRSSSKKGSWCSRISLFLQKPKIKSAPVRVRLEIYWICLNRCGSRYPKWGGFFWLRLWTHEVWFSLTLRLLKKGLRWIYVPIGTSILNLFTSVQPLSKMTFRHLTEFFQALLLTLTQIPVGICSSWEWIRTLILTRWFWVFTTTNG